VSAMGTVLGTGWGQRVGNRPAPVNHMWMNYIGVTTRCSSQYAPRVTRAASLSAELRVSPRNRAARLRVSPLSVGVSPLASPDIAARGRIERPAEHPARQT